MASPSLVRKTFSTMLSTEALKIFDTNCLVFNQTVCPTIATTTHMVRVGLTKIWLLGAVANTSTFFLAWTIARVHCINWHTLVG